MSAQDMEDVLDFACARYFGTSALFGTPESCLEMVERLAAIGVDEVACLIDFGVDTEAVLKSLRQLTRLRELWREREAGDGETLAALAERYRPTMFQCTPSRARMLLMDSERPDAWRSLHTWMV